MRYILVFSAVLISAGLCVVALAGLFSIALPVFLGVLIYFVPTVISGFHAFRYPARTAPFMAVQSLFKGLVVRWFLVGLGFAATFLVAPTINAAAVFTGFCLMIPAQSIAAMFASKSL